MPRVGPKHPYWRILGPRVPPWQDCYVASPLQLSRVLLWSQAWLHDEGETFQFLEISPSSLSSLLRTPGMILFFRLAIPKEERDTDFQQLLFFTQPKISESLVPRLTKGLGTCFKGGRKNREQTLISSQIYCPAIKMKRPKCWRGNICHLRLHLQTHLAINPNQMQGQMGAAAHGSLPPISRSWDMQYCGTTGNFNLHRLDTWRGEHRHPASSPNQPHTTNTTSLPHLPDWMSNIISALPLPYLPASILPFFLLLSPASWVPSRATNWAPC